jgi:hypothetical protein
MLETSFLSATLFGTVSSVSAATAEKTVVVAAAVAKGACHRATTTSVRAADGELIAFGV